MGRVKDEADRKQHVDKRCKGCRQVEQSWKRHFLKLAARSVLVVNGLGDENRIKYARKAMVWCGMGFNINGQWEEH